MRSHDISRWAFLLGDERDAWKKGFEDAAWREVAVPHDWSIEQGFTPEASSGTGYLPGGIGWYRAHVPLSEAGPLEGRHVRLVFHGAYKNADVWVNGYHLGGRPSGHAAFSFDVTEIVGYRPDDDLVVSVRIDHTDISDARWYNGSGLTRRVELEVHEAVRLTSLAFETLSVEGATARVRIAASLASAVDADVEVTHALRSLSRGSVTALAAGAAIAADGSAETVAEGAVPGADLWSDDAPHLYELTTTLTWDAGGEPARSEHRTVVGLRTFVFDPDRGFSINGSPRTLKGVCLHEDAGAWGVAVPPVVWLRRLLSLKRAGCNAIRMAHNPHAPELYALCDALGFFVIDEAFDEWENPKNKWWQGHNVYPPRHDGAAHDFPEWHERDLVAMIEAHRHHPSVIAWSIGNEVDYPNDPYASPLFAEMTGNNDASKPAAERQYDPSRPDIRRLTTIATRLAAIVRRADPTRPVTFAAAFPELSRQTGLLEPLDLVGYNYKEHLYEADHAHLPHKPFVGSENGHTYRAWRAVIDNEWISGQFLWTGIDYLGEARGWPVHGSPAGILTIAGFEKPTWHLRRSWWSDEPVLHLATRPWAEGERTLWNPPITRAWEYNEGADVEVLVFTNAPSVRVTAGGADVPIEWDDDHGLWRGRVAASAGPLEAVALRDGAELRDELHRRGPAARLDAVPWQAPASAVAACSAAGIDLGGALQIEVELLDAHGRRAAQDLPISVSVRGGELIGLDSGDLGDPSSYADSTRRSHEGRLVAFVRPERGATVNVALTAPGLPQTDLVCAPAPALE